MTYELKPLSCDPAKLKGLSEKLIVSHYENNYSGAVRRLKCHYRTACSARLRRHPGLRYQWLET
jgi:hypothetical protein